MCWLFCFSTVCFVFFFFLFDGEHFSFCIVPLDVPVLWSVFHYFYPHTCFTDLSDSNHTRCANYDNCFLFSAFITDSISSYTVPLLLPLNCKGLYFDPLLFTQNYQDSGTMFYSHLVELVVKFMFSPQMLY